MNALAKRLILLSAFGSTFVAGCSSKPTPALPNPSASSEPASEIYREVRVLDAATMPGESAQLPKESPETDSTNPNLSSKIAPPIIGQLKGRQHTIIIHTASDGPRFTITTPDGRVIATALSVDEIRAQHPTIYKAYEQTFAQGGAYLDASIGTRDLPSR